MSTILGDDPDNPGYKRPYTNLVYDDSTNTSNIQQVLLVDSILTDFQKYANVNTFTIVYDRFSTRKELLDVLTRKFSKISRIAIVSHFSNNPYFVDNTFLFNDMSTQFIIDLIKQFNVSNMDYLACNTLNNLEWKNFYYTLHAATGVIIGASDNDTGNIKYGGDWILESTNEDIHTIYFNEQIQNYSSLLITIVFGGITYTTTGSNAQATGYDNVTTVIDFPATVSGYTVTSIIDNIFWGISSVISITFAGGGTSYITTIGAGAFGYTGISTITIPASVTSITGSATVFYMNYKLQNIYVQSGNAYYKSIDGVLTNINGTIIVGYPKGNPRTSYTIPSSVTTVITNSFYTLPLSTLIIPSNVTTIENDSIRDCAALLSVYFLGNTLPTMTATGNFTATGDTGYVYSGANVTALQAKGLFTTVSIGSLNPLPPTELVLTPGNQNLSIAFTAGSDIGSAITNYEYSINSGASWISLNSIVSPVVVNFALTDGTTYNIILRSINSFGTSASSSTASFTYVIITQAKVNVAGNWPMTINGGTLAIPKIVSFASNLTLNSANNCFYVGSQYVTIDGMGYTVTFSAASYPGLVQNGTNSAAGYSNVTVRNIVIAAGSTSLAAGSGWIGQQYFGAGLNSSTTCSNVIITRCINNSPLSISGTAGITGQYGGAKWGNLTISNCINNGNCSANDSFGITSSAPGGNNGYCLITNCINNGSLGVLGGVNTSGFAGNAAAVQDSGFTSGGQCVIENCINNGNVAAGNAGFFGNAPGYLNNGAATIVSCWIKNCYSVGSCAGGGIYFNIAGTITTRMLIDNCFLTRGANFTGSRPNVVVTNSLSTSNTWTDSSANTILTGTNGTVWYDMDTTSVTTPYVLSSITIPSAPTNLSLTQINNIYTLTFNNSNGPGISNYKYSLDSGTTWISFSPAVTSSPVIIPGIPTNLPYYIRLMAVNANGDGTPSSVLYGPGNKLLNSYIKGSFDVSGTNVNVLGGNVYINKDATVVGNLYANKNLMIGSYNSTSTVYPLYNTGTTQISSKLFVGGDASFNSRLFVGGDVSMNGFVSASSYAVNSIPLNAISGWVAATSNITTDASFNNRIFVGGDASLNGKLFVAEDATINNRLVISGDTTVSNRLFVGSDATLNNRMFIGGDVSMNVKLFVSNDVSTNSAFNVLGDVSFNGKLFTGGDITMNNRMFLGGDATVNGQMFAAGDATLNGQMFVSGDASMNSRVFLGGDVSMNNRLFVGGDVSMNNRLFVGGDVSMNNRLFIGVDVSMNTKLFVGGDLSMNSKLFVLGDVSMNQNLFVSGDVSLNGRMNINTDVSLVNLNILKTAANQPRNIALNNAVLLGASSTYTATPITLTNANPVPQNIFISVPAPVLTLPTMNTNFAGMQLYIRKIGLCVNTDLSINAAATNFLVAAGTSSANVTTLSIPKITSYTSIISDGVRWFQM